ncbi:type-F conjugative transfer system pilin assembly thiol-disulfide isomerase TrbB [Legionella longbeachae]|uniref:conjugal transfer protein TraF n=1 Tax=Legionella longbeachae TaxID=450 RepID=UPI0009B73A0D|nr:conjugal transfer protein TraF [Legionella longbeachae]VEE02698.1 sex pilus assembly TraF, thiol-disulfide isomerase and thioredoxins [Legionella oakridgensis]ARB91038.1 type-F conjugative transfer system pilin assembly thiol-disulfide isomerase TrbB [Legionella longbeachae]ARM32535.1 conjugal transfer protein TraF [Legionella longbeachae]RZV21171.1 type-F conjugative transfer system pilin assembly thiol-disulfide isomerase TrbB [Legionella longbeachae]UAK45762.1 conjugal transfer protein T
MSLKQILILVLSLFYSSWSLANDRETLKHAAQEQGLFFFYSSSCPYCQRFAPVLKEFSEHYGFKVLAISVDRGYLPSFPDAELDEGQKNQFQVTVLPSLFLINPYKEQAALVTEGALEEEELSRRILKIIHLQVQR